MYVAYCSSYVSILIMEVLWRTVKRLDKHILLPGRCLFNNTCVLLFYAAGHLEKYLPVLSSMPTVANGLPIGNVQMQPVVLLKIELLTFRC